MKNATSKKIQIKAKEPLDKRAIETSNLVLQPRKRNRKQFEESKIAVNKTINVESKNEQIPMVRMETRKRVKTNGPAQIPDKLSTKIQQPKSILDIKKSSKQFNL